MERHKQITASNVGIIAKHTCRSTTKVAQLWWRHFYTISFVVMLPQHMAMSRSQPPEVQTCKLRHMLQQALQHMTVDLQSIQSTNGWLPAQMGWWTTQHTQTHWVLLSIKSIQVQKYDTGRCCYTSQGFLSGLERLITLEKTHHYCYQIQATMFCTQRKWCDIVVCTLADIHIERLNWDSAFLYAIIPKL